MGYYPKQISWDTANESLRKYVGVAEDIPWCYLDSVINPAYDNRRIFFLGEEGEDDGVSDWSDDDDSVGEKKVLYTYLDVAISVFLCCNKKCKTLLAQKLRESKMSVPIILPDMENPGGIIVQSSALEGLCKDIEYETYIPIVTFVGVNGKNPGLLKSHLINIALDPSVHKPFYNESIEAKKMALSNDANFFGHGSIEAAMYNPPKSCTCHNPKSCICKFIKSVLFLNVYGNISKFKTQKQFACKISAIMVVVVDAGYLSEEPDNLEILKDIIEASTQTLLVFTNDGRHTLQDCQNGVASLQKVANETDAKVMGVFNRRTAEPDNDYMIRGNLRKRINALLELDEGETLLKEQLQDISIKVDGMTIEP